MNVSSHSEKKSCKKYATLIRHQSFLASSNLTKGQCYFTHLKKFHEKLLTLPPLRDPVEICEHYNL